MKNKYLFVLLFIAFLVRLYKINLIHCIAPDGVAYINAARDMAAGRGFNPIWPPLYPWLISIFWKLGINPELSGQIASVIFGVLTVLAAYIITKAVFSPIIANITVIFSVFHPYLVRYSAEVLTDSLFTFLITSCVFCGWQVLQKKRFVYIFLTGLLAGLAYLAKPEGIFLLPVIFIWWIFGFKELLCRKIGNILLALIIFLAISFPYLYAVKKDTGHWMISQKQTVVFSIALQEEGYTEEFLNISPLRFAKENPKEFFIKIGRGFLTLLGRIPDAYNPVLFLFLIIGLLFGVGKKKYLLYISTFLVMFFVGYAVFHPGRRYLVGWVPLTLFLSACGVDKIGKRFGHKIGVWAIFFIILAMLPKTLASERAGGRQWKEAGIWIKNKSGTSMKIMSEDARTAFYAGGEHAPWSETGFDMVNYIVSNKEINLLTKVDQVSNQYFIYSHVSPRGWPRT